MQNENPVASVSAGKAIALYASLLLAPAALNIACAAPVNYTFSTGGAAPGSTAASLFGAGASVSGTFIYDSAAPAVNTAANGAIIYGGPPTSFKSLNGTVAGLNFSDVRGSTTVGNDVAVSIFPAADFFQLNAEPPIGTGIHDLTGFDVGGFTLVNIRMFWLEGQLGITDFLVNQDLPSTPPTFSGRLALDFYPTGNLTGPLTNFAFFDGLRVQSVAVIPEPETYALLLAGLGLLGLARRRQQSPTA